MTSVFSSFHPVPVNTNEVEVVRYMEPCPLGGQPVAEYSVRYRGLLAGAVRSMDGVYMWMWDMSPDPDDLHMGDASSLTSAVNKVLQLTASYLATQ